MGLPQSSGLRRPRRRRPMGQGPTEDLNLVAGPLSVWHGPAKTGRRDTATFDTGSASRDELDQLAPFVLQSQTTSGKIPRSQHQTARRAKSTSLENPPRTASTPSSWPCLSCQMKKSKKSACKWLISKHFSQRPSRCPRPNVCPTSSSSSQAQSPTRSNRSRSRSQR